MKIEELFCVRDKIVLITGGSRGLGEMIARAYVGNGEGVHFRS
jgi:NAD(P)-dependent dehydrogenase (short-subunit alcohol dehydrogenase family)